MKKIILCFLISFLCFFVSGTKADEIKQIIYIDPGHGGIDGGASVGDILEKDLALQISLKIKEVFQNYGYEVLLTRQEDKSLCSNDFIKREDMLKRVNLINNSKAILALSIHLNKFSIEKYSGAQVFYSKANSSNSLLAECIQESMKNFLQNTDRKTVYRDNVFLLNKVIIPCVIIECGFLSNNKELSLLCQSDYQYLIAKSILFGVNHFLST